MLWGGVRWKVLNSSFLWKRLQETRLESQVKLLWSTASLWKEKLKAEAREKSEAKLKQAEADKVEAEEARKQAAENAKQAREEAAKQAIQAHKDKKAAAKQADKAQAEAEKVASETARLGEIARRKVEDDRIAADEKKREANVKHKKKINNEVLDALIALGVDHELGVSIVIAAARGEIPNIKISY